MKTEMKIEKVHTDTDMLKQDYTINRHTEINTGLGSTKCKNMHAEEKQTTGAMLIQTQKTLTLIDKDSQTEEKRPRK